MRTGGYSKVGKKNSLMIIDESHGVVGLHLDNRILQYPSKVIPSALPTCLVEVHMQRHVKK